MPRTRKKKNYSELGLDLVVEHGQEIQFWVMRRDSGHVQIAFDCGDNGFVVLTNAQARQLGRDLLVVAEKRDESGAAATEL